MVSTDNPQPALGLATFGEATKPTLVAEHGPHIVPVPAAQEPAFCVPGERRGASSSEHQHCPLVRLREYGPRW
jgi:hypothetical protein